MKLIKIAVLGAMLAAGAAFAEGDATDPAAKPVSYTHLTLPPSDLV